MYSVKHLPENVLDVTVAGEITAEDYESLVPRLESEIEQHDKIRVLWDMSEMESVEPRAIWEDLKFDVEHRADYERVAIVGDKRWHDWATQLFKPLAEGAVRYFDVGQRDEAAAWVREKA
ncbi:MAG: STAS/SEC14 domain-containing protein [Nitratireductor sp.]|nr:STAS/SEC14 domain-containing protein [Nitratireductor sp.]|tara:strand:+ start:104 stop:463 length:360 start_codon:yes stop_codon:yes gene_type:complete